MTVPGLVVNEIFYSIQGESSFMGYPSVFIRLTGCNLRCRYCDTQYAYDEGSTMSIDEIIETAQAYPCRLAEVTGGEPLIQKHTPGLIRGLLEKGFEVLLETNGSLDLSSVDSRCVKIVDIKCPSSGEHRKNRFENLERLTRRDEIKFVVADRADYLYARDLYRRFLKDTCVENIFFSPVFSRLPYQQLASWILEDGIRARFGVQLHKMVWHSEKRGV